MHFERKFAWPSRWPTSKTGEGSWGSNGQIHRLIKSLITENGKGWVDPMCGRDKFCEFRNDFRKTGTTALTNLDALEFLKGLPSSGFNGVLYDPPYNDKQGLAYSKNNVSKSNVKYWWAVRKEIARIVKPGGIIILLAWNSNGFNTGDNKFLLRSVHLFAHGSERNDTIVSVWQKNSNLTLF